MEQQQHHHQQQQQQPMEDGEMQPSPRTILNHQLFPHLAHIPPALAPEALLDAVNEGQADVVRDLVKRDAALANHRDGFGQTPLMWAAYKGRADMVNCLLDCGAGVNECETRRARTALYLACEFDHAEVVALLLRRGADQRLPAQRGWTVLSRGFEGWTPLIIAGYNGCPAVLRCLLAHPDAELDKGDGKGATALWWAAIHNRPDAVRVLLEAGADFLRTNDEGKTPCEAARERGNHECTALLEAAERAYVMTRSRRLSRESEAWARLLHTQLLPSLGLPSYLHDRVGIDTSALPRAQPPHPAVAQAMLLHHHHHGRSEEEEEEEEEEGGDMMMETDTVEGYWCAAAGKHEECKSSSFGYGYGYGGKGHSHSKQEGFKVGGGEQQQQPVEEEGRQMMQMLRLGEEEGAGGSYDKTAGDQQQHTAFGPSADADEAWEAEAREFGDWRWGRPAPHYSHQFRHRFSSSSLSNCSLSHGSSSGSGGSSFLSRAFSRGTSSGSLKGKGKGVVPLVPDSGSDETDESLEQQLQSVLPQAVAHYVSSRMRFDVWLQFRDMLYSA